MKTKKKNKAAPPSTPQPDNVSLTPRQLALQKLYRVLGIWGGIAAVLAVIVLGTLYGHLLFPRSKYPWAMGGEMREPKLNANEPPGPAPEGMVWIPGGEFYMGDDDGQDCPVHLVYVDGFWMDKHEVTNEQYAQFVAATGYVTFAEKTPEPKDFPDTPPDKLKPFSIVFKKPGPNDPYNLRTHQGWWDIKYGAYWKQPEGPGSTIEGRKKKHPVVHINYDDAVAYCLWAKKRLPTEAEWEFAARGGLDRKIYSWGDDLKPNGKWMANIWQGDFPRENTREDGYEGSAPVGSYPPNGYGLHDMAGNVWEWCSDWYQGSYYLDSPEKNPLGPNSGFDPAEPGSQKRVQRGGSFLCAENYCVRYVVGFRGKGEVTSAQNHCGFRCARDAK